MPTFEYNGVKIEHLTHSAFRIESHGKVLYIDPFQIGTFRKDADILIFTHDHYDHCSIEDTKKVAKDTAVIVAASNCRSKLIGLPHKKMFLNPGDSITVDDVRIDAVPAYNIGKPFHPKAYKGIGVVITINNVRIYHAGDTDFIPEMKELKDIDIALLPVSGVYVMDWKEAAAAVEAIKPKVAIPMHYGVIVGNIKDAERFKEKASSVCKVVII